jgi:hypothetical protein
MNNNSNNDNENKNKKNKKYTHSNNILILDGPYKGYYGYVKDFRPGYYSVSFVDKEGVSIQKSLKPHEIERINENQVKIKKGKYTDIIANIKHYSPPEITVEIQANLKKVKLNPKAVLYMDLQLKNGNNAQVNSIDIDEITKQYSSINISEMVDHQIIKRRIGLDAIESLHSGFSFEDQVLQEETQETETQPQQEQEFIHPEDIKTPADIDIDDIDDIEVDYEEREGDEENEESEEKETNEEDQYKASFKDTQRTSVEKEELTPNQTHIKNLIKKILHLLSMNEEAVVEKLIENIEGVIDNIQKDYKKEEEEDQKNLYLNGDYVYISICMIFYGIRGEYVMHFNKQLEFDKYITILIKAKILNLSNIENTILPFITTISNNDLNYINKNKKGKNNVEAIKIFQSYWCKYLSNLLNIPFGNTSSYTPKFIPIGTPSKYKSVLKNSFTAYNNNNNKNKQSTIDIFGKPTEILDIENLLTNDALDHYESEIPIEWGTCQDLFNKKKQDLLELSKNAKKEKDKENFKYIYNNLERAPFAIKEKLVDSKVLSELKNRYKNLLMNCSKKVDDDAKEKYKSIDLYKNINILLPSQRRQNKIKNRLDLEKSRSDIKRRREKVSKLSTADLFGSDSEDEDEEEIIIKDTFKYQQEARKREMKKLINTRTRDMNFQAYRDQQKAKKEAKGKNKMNESETEETEETEKTFEDKFKNMDLNDDDDDFVEYMRKSKLDDEYDEYDEAGPSNKKPRI